MGARALLHQSKRREQDKKENAEWDNSEIIRQLKILRGQYAECRAKEDNAFFSTDLGLIHLAIRG